MKRSHSSSCSSSSSYSSSSSPEPEILDLKSQKKPKAKRAKRDNNGNNSKDSNAKSNNNGKRSSIYRGVTRHRWTGRFEAHLWDKSCWNNVQNKKGRQVYLGAYDSEEAAARTYDLAALKYWGPTTILNFPIDSYTKEIEEMEKVTKEEYLASLRRRSSGFSRGVSKYRGVARHHHNGRWEARIGRVFGNKYLYLGTYKTQEEAAAAYDMAAIEYRGANAVTNFDVSNYLDRLNTKINIIPKDALAPSPPSPPRPSSPPQQAEGPHLHCPNQALLSSLESSSLATILPINSAVDHPDLNWSFLDTGGFVSLPVPDLPIEKPGDLLDLFDDTEFEDNIDLIFGSCGSTDSSENDFKGGILDKCDSRDDFGVLNNQVGGGGGGGGAGSPSSSLSSPSSSTTITSFSCM